MKRMTIKEAAAYIGASEYKLYEMVRQKLIPHYRVGSKILFREATIDAWMKEQEDKNSSTVGT